MKHGDASTGEIVPLFCGSGELTYGTRTLLKKIVELLPVARRGRSRRSRRRWWAGSSRPSPNPTWATSPSSGSTPARSATASEVFNAEHETIEKLNHLSVQQGKDRLEVDRLSAGDIGSVAKLKDTHTDDTFCWREHPVRLPPIPFPEAVATSAVLVKQRGEEDKLAAGLHKLHEEDPTFHFEYNSELGQTLIHGMGERHFEIHPGPAGAEVRRPCRAGPSPGRLSRDLSAERPRVRGSTRSSPAAGASTATAGSGWRRCRGVRATSSWTRSSAASSRTSTSRRWIAASRRQRFAGLIAGYPLVDFKAECFDGSYHDVDSNEMSFKMAGIMAFRNVTPKARPVLLEPLMDVDAWAPDDVLGDVMGDLSSRRGQILGTEPDGRLTRVRAIVPAGRALQVLHHAPFHHPRARDPPAEVPRLCRGASGRGGASGGGEPEGASANSVSRRYGGKAVRR